ncbi:MAG: SixA phosphatase family protein [Halothiobacillaceae bacterium]
MKTLLVLRHGKSSWKNEDLADHERPLAPRGKREARRMGEELARRQLVPDLVVSSPAKRARSTARRVIEASGYTGALLLEPRFYFTDLNTCLAVLAALPQEARTVLIIGHNPLWEELVSHLTRQPTHLPTAALAVIDLPVDAWTEIGASGAGTLRLLLEPQTLATSTHDAYHPFRRRAIIACRQYQGPIR